MNRLINYIINGQGWGLKLILIYSLILAMVGGFNIKRIGDNMIPSAQEIAYKILPIKIEQGRIINPSGFEGQFNLNLSSKLPDFKFPFVMNTNVDTLDVKNLKEGIYLTRSSLYTVTNGQVRVAELSDTLEIPQGDYTDFFQKVVNYTTLALIFVMSIILFAFWSIASLFYSIIAWAITKIFKRRSTFAIRMRLSVCGIILIHTICYIISSRGSVIDSQIVSILIMLFMGIFIYRGFQEE